MDNSTPESPNNMGFVHESCAPKPDPILAEKPVDWFLGKFVKLGFPFGPNDLKEHMWVRVDRITLTEEAPSGEELIGEVNNDPIRALDWPCGTVIAFSRNEVEAVILEDGTELRPAWGMN